MIETHDDQGVMLSSFDISFEEDDHDHHGDGGVYGHIKFRDSETHGREHLDFEPRGEKIEVLQGGSVILEVEFPSE